MAAGKRAKERPATGKVALIGTHGVGKTVLTFTLAGILRARGADCDVVHENSRHSPFPINEETTLEGQLWILAAQWKAELEALRRARLILCDRSVLDNYAYLVEACGRQDWLRDWLARWLDSYDLLLHVPAPRGPVPGDSARSTSPAFRRRIERAVERLVAEFDVERRVVRLPADRAGHIPAALNALRARGFLPGDQPELL